MGWVVYKILVTDQGPIPFTILLIWLGLGLCMLGCEESGVHEGEDEPGKLDDDDNSDQAVKHILE